MLSGMSIFVTNILNIVTCSSYVRWAYGVTALASLSSILKFVLSSLWLFSLEKI